MEECKIKKNLSSEEGDALLALNKYQDEVIEHREPKAVWRQAGAIEALGDVFRELTGRRDGNYSTSYIDEKLERLARFDQTGGKEDLNKCDHFRQNEAQFKRDSRAWIDELDKWQEKIRAAPIDPCKKEILERVPLIQSRIMEWGLFENSTYAVKEYIKGFVEMVRDRY